MATRGCVRVQNLQNTTEDWSEYILPSYYSPMGGWGELPIEVAIDLVINRDANYNVPDISYDEARKLKIQFREEDSGPRGAQTVQVAPPPTIEQLDEVISFHPEISDDGSPIFVVISPIPWGGASQGQTTTELAKGLAYAGAKVIHISLQPSSGDDDYPVPPNVHFLHPPQLNWLGCSEAPTTAVKSLVASIKDSVPKPGTLILTHPTPSMVHVCKALKASGWKVVYHAVDDWAAMEPDKELHKTWEIAEVEGKKFMQAEVDLAKGAATLFTATSERLAKRLSILTPCEVVENGWDERHFPMKEVVEAPGDMARSDSTVVYWGGLHGHWIDRDLIGALCKEIPGAAVNIIGFPPKPHIELPNLNWMGFRPNAKLYGYGRHAHVGIVPFKKCPVSDCVNPIKIYEYLACKLPVVVTGIADVQGWPGVTVATKKNFVTRVREAVTAKITGEFPHAEVEQFLATRTWTHRARRLMEIVGV